jgi:hypothetical protein
MNRIGRIAGDQVMKLKAGDMGIQRANVREGGRNPALELGNAQVFKVHGVPPWLGEFVQDAIIKLLAMRLDGMPSHETSDLTTIAWVEIILKSQREWVQDLDLPRLKAALDIVQRRAARWPAPRDLIDAMPPRSYPRALPKPRTEAMRQAGLQALQDLRNKLRGCA